MKIKHLFIFGALLPAVAGFSFFALSFSPFSFPAPLKNLFQKNRSAAYSILTGIQSLNTLETAAYDMMLVFPFDFMEGEANWRTLKNQYDSGTDLSHSKRRNADIYKLCREVGMDPGLPDYQFTVISVSLRAGVDTKIWLEQLPDSPEPNTDSSAPPILIIPPPPVKITSFSVQDKDTSADGFPDIALSPESWRHLIEQLEPKLRERALKQGFLQTAQAEAMRFLSEIFNAAGVRVGFRGGEVL